MRWLKFQRVRRGFVFRALVMMIMTLLCFVILVVAWWRCALRFSKSELGKGSQRDVSTEEDLCL